MNDMKPRSRKPALLHNMSAPPKASINHAGAKGTGRGLLVALGLNATRGWPKGTLSFAALARWLGIELPRARLDAERDLRRLVVAHAKTMPLPAACLVTSDQAMAQGAVEDRLSIVTLLSKSSGHVYLRDKEPNFDRLAPNASLVLIIPNEWRPK
jgi:hypothetical protein